MPPASYRPEALAAPESGIVAVANHARGRDGVLQLWAGEGDQATPDFISRAAAEALTGGETFYTWQRGIPELRQSLVRYHERHFDRTFSEDAFVVCGSGMQAIQIAIDATCGAGDDALYLSPAWPNFAAACGIAGARSIPVALDRVQGGWHLDIDKLSAAITPRTRAIFVNSPGNPTGWTADVQTLQALLALSRRHGFWIIADEIYALFHYGEGRAASFMDIMEPDDRVLFVNTFSKNWAMTGWRMGWITIPPRDRQLFENLVQYSTSGVAQFMQRGGIAALDQGDAFVAEQVTSARAARDAICRVLATSPRARFQPPAGAFYLMFSVDGVTDSRKAALDLVDRAGVAIAPGIAFGAEGEGCFRICFHRDPAQVEEAGRRIVKWLETA